MDIQGSVRAAPELDLGMYSRTRLGWPTSPAPAMDSPLPAGIYLPASGGSRDTSQEKISLATSGLWVPFGFVGTMPGCQKLCDAGLVPRFS